MEELVAMRFTWNLDNFSKLKTHKHFSEIFFVGDFKWQIVVYPKGSNGKHYLSIYLNVADTSKLPSGWRRYAQFTLTVVNQRYSNKSVTIDTQHEFSESQSDWGFTSFMPLSELFDHNNGFLVNDTCIVEAEVAISKADIKLLEHERLQRLSNVDSLLPPIPLTTRHLEPVLVYQNSLNSEKSSSEFSFQDSPRSWPIDPSIFQEHEEVPSAPVGELVDFRGLGQIDKAFVPLLEEVCSLHPSLIECQRKRSRMFAEWAFTGLGRLLHFLKTTKVKNMDEDACEHLKLLWEELDAFKFDLAWLEPHVQSALGMKKFVVRAGQVKRLNEDVDALEIEMKGLRARLAVAEVEHEVSKGDLAEAEERFSETNMEREVGY